MDYELYLTDPDSKLWYGINWTDWLAEKGPTVKISLSAWTVPAGVTKIDESNTETHAFVKLSALGPVDTEYIVKNHITTTDGQEEDRSFVLKMREK